MTGFCLSLAPILRCESLTRLESEVLIIPVALELVFSVCLVFSNWGKSRSSLLLAAEGWLLFALSLTDLLAHILPTTRDSLRVFRILDIVIGATSFLPVLCYLLFLFFFLRSNLLPSLPRRFQRITQYTLMLFIPAIVAADLLGSFVGISYTFIRNPNSNSASQGLLAIGFANDRDQMLWTFFSSLGLALLAAYQAINFCVVFYRLVKSFIDQHQIEIAGASDQSVVLFKGLGWLTIGLLLGAVETVVGFAFDGFGIPLTRRILRFLSRACLIIGVVKGIDSREDFTVIEPSKPSRRRSKRKSTLRVLISNPRHSTFRRMSEPLDPQLAEAIANLGIERTVSNDLTQRINRSPQMAQVPFPPQASNVSSPSPVLTYRPRPTSRVTVLMTPGTAPTLNLRFSSLDMPSPAEIAEFVQKEVESRPGTAIYSAPPSSRRSRSRSQGTSHLLLHGDDTFRTTSFFETASIPPQDSFMPDLRDVAKPPRARTSSWRYSGGTDYAPSDSGISGYSVSTAEALRGVGPRRCSTMPPMPMPRQFEGSTRSSANFFYEHDNLASEELHGAELTRDLSQKTYKPQRYEREAPPMPAYRARSEYSSATESRSRYDANSPEPVPRDPFAPSTEGHRSLASLELSLSRTSSSIGESSSKHSNLSSVITKRSQASAPWLSRTMPSSFRPVSAQEIDMYEQASSPASSIFDNEPRPSTDTTDEPQRAKRSLKNGREKSPRPDLVRIKTVGRAPRRETPTPSASLYSREPVAFEDLEIIPSWEAYSSSSPSTASPSTASLHYKPIVKHDSNNVLPRDDEEHMKHTYEPDEEGVVWVGNEARAV